MLARIAGRLGLHTCVSGAGGSLPAPLGSGISAARTSLDSPLPVQVLEASPKGHYTQLVVQPLGWYNEPLTVVMHGDDAPQRGERLFVWSATCAAV
ncbi:sulfate ABC transporter, ATP-binding protein [Escherichia coli]|nr:sulfate ABC transporter, ATP-binding protein [Escherichia coli]